MKKTASPRLKKLIKHLVNYRSLNDMAQHHLSTAAGINPKTYEHIELGHREAGAKNWMPMIEYFQGVNDTVMVEALLVYVKVNILALKAMFKQSEWRFPPDYPPRGVRVEVGCNDGAYRWHNFACWSQGEGWTDIEGKYSIDHVYTWRPLDELPQMPKRDVKE